MPKLTKRIVDAAQPNKAQVFTWDSEVKGFGLRVTPAGAKSYVLSYRDPSGQTRRTTIGKHGSPWTCDEARTRAAELLRRLDGGVDPRTAKVERKTVTTVADLVELYLAEGPAERPNKKASSWETDSAALARHVLPLIGRQSVKSLSTADLQRLQADIAAGKTAVDEKTGKHGRARVTGGKGTATRALATVSAMLSFAVRRKLVTENVASGVQRFKGRTMERFLVEREVLALAEALAKMEEAVELSPVMANAIKLLMLTGCRKDEIRSLEWAWVDAERGCLRLPDSKTGAKVVPLAAAALAFLASLDRDTPYVLPSSRTDGHVVGVQKAWDGVRQRATEILRAQAEAERKPPSTASDLSTLRLHDLRHSYASFAVTDGAALFLVGKVLGHKQTRTTEIYAHAHDDPLRAVADRTGEKIAGMMRAGAERGRASAASQSGSSPVQGDR